MKQQNISRYVRTYAQRRGERVSARVWNPTLRARARAVCVRTRSSRSSHPGEQGDNRFAARAPCGRRRALPRTTTRLSTHSSEQNNTKTYLLTLQQTHSLKKCRHVNRKITQIHYKVSTQQLNSTLASKKCMDRCIVSKIAITGSVKNRRI